MSDSNNGQEQTEGTVEELSTSEQPAEETQEPTLPDGVKERTAAEFEKLKAHNKAMAEELKALRGENSRTSVLDELRPNVETVQTTVPSAEPQFIDTEGFVDSALLNSTLTNTQKSADEARRIALQTQQEIQRFQESQLVQAVHKEYPELDPNNSDQFDPTFYDFVKNELIGQLTATGREDLRAAASKARKILTRTVKKETISSKEQASAPTGTTQRSAPVNQSDLVARTYKGDRDAIFKRLQASGN
jgi:hypothetical protein